MAILCVTFPTNIKLFMHYYCIIAKRLQRPMLMILCEFFVVVLPLHFILFQSVLLRNVNIV